MNTPFRLTIDVTRKPLSQGGYHYIASSPDMPFVLRCTGNSLESAVYHYRLRLVELCAELGAHADINGDGFEIDYLYMKEKDLLHTERAGTESPK